MITFSLSRTLRFCYRRLALHPAAWVAVVLVASILALFLLELRPLIGYKTVWLSTFATGISILFFEGEDKTVKARQIVGAAIMLIVPPILLAYDHDVHYAHW